MSISMKRHGTGSFSSAQSGHIRARRVVSPSSGIVRGKFPSRKNQAMVHHEGLLELDAFYLFEASPLVATYREQPCTLYYPDGDRLRKYTPDIELTLSSGAQLFIEIKPDAKAREPEIAHKLACIRSFLARNNQQFFVLTDNVIRQQPRLSNLRWIYQMAAREKPTPGQILAGLEHLKPLLPMSIKAAIDLLSPFGCHPCNFLLAGLLHAHLDQPITLDSEIDLAKESGHEWLQF